MIFIFPLSHEDSVVKRIPVVTISIIIINVILYGVTIFKAPDTTETLSRKQYSLAKYYSKRPYLTFPDQTFKKLHPEIQKKLTPLRQEEYNVPVGYTLQDQQETIDQKINEFEEAFSQNFYRKYGYVPARDGLLSIVASCFLHSGFLHLLFNMLFLFLSGFIIEDYWGRILFLLFYISGGIVAGLAHGYMFPESYIPLVGASGAVAALMGAFLIRCLKTRIYFFYAILILLWFRAGRFLAPAYVMLPLWLLQQLFFALYGGESGGVAYWAHIGGFVYGVGVAVFMKVFHIEEKYIAPQIEEKICVYNVEQHDEKDTLNSLSVLSEKNPDIGFIHREKSELLLKMGDRKQALFECRRAIVLYLQQSDYEEAMTYYMEMTDTFEHFSLKYDYQARLIDLLISEREYKVASQASMNCFHYSKKLSDLPSATKALILYGNICADYLGRGDLAIKVWTHLLNSFEKFITPEQVSALKSKIKNVQISCKNEIPVNKRINNQNVSSKISPKGKIRLLETLNGTGKKYHIAVIEPRTVSRAVAVDDGFLLEGASLEPSRYNEIYAVIAFQVIGESDLELDLFIKSEMRPFRLSSGRIAYADFLNKPLENASKNFRQFVRSVLTKSSSVYTNRQTYDFVESKKIQVFGSYSQVERYEKEFWAKLMNDTRYYCRKCSHIEWCSSVDENPKQCEKCKTDMLEL